MDKTAELRRKAEQIIDFTPQEISQISPEEIQRLFYDLQIYQIELQMQNEELKAVQNELTSSRDRFHFIYHQVPIGIISLNHLGFIEQVNESFCKMLGLKTQNLVHKHFSTVIVESDTVVFNSRFNGFFKVPKHKSMNLHLRKADGSAFLVKIWGTLDIGNDCGPQEGNEHSLLILAVTDISDLETK